MYGVSGGDFVFRGTVFIFLGWVVGLLVSRVKVFLKMFFKSLV